MSIDKSYDSAATEEKLYPIWEKSSAFACNPKSNAAPYCIMIPPPNVTGSLHMGHGLTFTLQDTLIRYRRMRGDDVLWQPGTDHAGIATQMVVERNLAAQKIDRREIGREAFLEKVWEWKAESGGNITRQLKRLGASADWARERFTMDAGLSKAVIKVFVDLYNEKLIYKDTRLVNWDPKMLTAISDLEVEMKEIKSNLWHFKYPIEGTDQFIVVATTRPETMLGDTAVAVHPNDERYKALIGKSVILPLVGRRIPIVADEYADPETGSGAVKITPAHDFNDYEVAKRNKLPMISILDKHAHLNENVPEKYRGMERFAARKQIVADLEELGLVEKIEPHVHTVPHGDRSGVPIEPWLSEQWYCDAKTLAEPAIKAVEDGRMQFVPQQWENTYFAWMRNIEPWCISRQLWWGHQIPAWYGADGKIFVASSEEEALNEAAKHYGKKVDLRRDEDVLDTWFSSALWPFSTLGWPDITPELERYYPTDVLVTGFDIIFFWVARMMMMGLHFMKDVPFRKVYIHALVRDEKGQKMSKTKGNVIDPLDMISKYGCDALRFTMANMSTPGRDIRLSPARIEGNRNFSTKLWNAARYCQMNLCEWQDDFDPATVKHKVNRWIIGETKLAADKVGGLLDQYRFDLASSAAYDFIWNDFCDWYLEFTKPILMGDDEAAKTETRAATAWVMAQMLKILHPFMPYITEELWGKIVSGKELLMSTLWPELSGDLINNDARDEIDWVIRLISAVRAIRAELNVPAGAQIKLQIKGMNDANSKRLELHKSIILRLARLAEISHSSEVPKGAVQTVLDEATLVLPLAGVIDIEQEKARLGKESDKWSAEIKKIENKLANKDFVNRAPPEVVDEQRERKAEAEAMVEKLKAAQRSLMG
ncbi:MAG: valine--tRNA ligase [Alphaproteobacteria bacterium]|nr:valine--tRNA ligase [Alphaproteobacteria bacterium]